MASGSNAGASARMVDSVSVMAICSIAQGRLAHAA
jgi:hypothetical protein